MTTLSKSWDEVIVRITSEALFLAKNLKFSCGLVVMCYYPDTMINQFFVTTAKAGLRLDSKRM